MAFAFLLPLTIIGMVLLWFVDTDKAKLEARQYLEDEARMLYKESSVESEKVV